MQKIKNSVIYVYNLIHNILIMTTQLISLNEYRKNLSTIWKKSQAENIKYIVLVHSKPVMEVKPIYNNIIEEVEPDEWEKKAMKRYEQDKKDWKLEYSTIDFSKINSENDFISLLESENE